MNRMKEACARLGPTARVTALAISCISGACISGAAVAGQRYGVDIFHSSWKSIDASQECILTQEIPNYGRIWFSGTPEGDLGFALRVEQPYPRGGFAAVDSVPAPWQHNSESRSLGKVRTSPGRNPIEQRSGFALRVFHEFEKGRNLQLRYLDPAYGKDQVVVTVSALHFREAQSEFVRCLQGHRALQAMADPWDLRAAGLPDDTLDLSVYFASGSDRLSQGAYAALDTYAKRFTGLSGQTRLSLSGFADPRGDKMLNQALSRRRAERVKACLIGLGVPRNRIVLRSFGSTGQIAPNADEHDYTRERRVSLTLMRDQHEPTGRRTVALRNRR